MGKDKLEIQNNGKFLSVKCQDFLILKWYQNKIQTWSYQVFVPSKEIISNHNYNKILVKSHINNILEQDDKFLWYPQYKTLSNYQTLLKTKYFDEKILDDKDSKKNLCGK
jgi:hypothetical protein